MNTYATPNRKSAQVTVNPADQAIVAAGTTLEILGSLATDTGCAIATKLNNFKLCRSGLYATRYQITIVPTAAGILTAQLKLNGLALPETLVQLTVAAGSTYTIVIEAPAYVIQTCCNAPATITAEVGGVDGTVSYVSASTVKLA